MDLHALKNEGWTNKEIAEELGYHPATVAKWLEAGGPPKTAVVCDERRVMTSVWRARIEVLSGTHPRLLATSVHNKLSAEVFGGSSLEPITHAKGGLVLPGVKCRGREYLRIIYGPEYLQPMNLERLRQRSLRRKSSLARREFALGIEALDRFVANKHSARVHECVFGVLALESEPVDPRL